MHKVPAIILSGGSEIVSIALAEELLTADIPVVVISLGKPSLLIKAIPSHYYFEINWPPTNPEKTIDALLEVFEKLGAGSPQLWPIFATEDGGLRFLFEYQSSFENYVVIPSAKKLRMGGLDKAEFFQFLDENDYSHYYPPTKIVNSPSTAINEISNWAEDLILKPSIKPFSMLMKGMDSKILIINKEDGAPAIEKKLSAIWEESESWILQKKIKVDNNYEQQWCGVRWSKNKSDIEGISAIEKLKYPLSGGSGCWVESVYQKNIHNISKKIIQKTDIIGCAEISYLSDNNDTPLLLELNPRFWLQTALANTSGFPLVVSTYNALTKTKQMPFPKHQENRSWVNVERMILSTLKGENSSYLKGLIHTIVTINSANYVAGYSCKLKGVRLRWIQRMARNILHAN